MDLASMKPVIIPIISPNMNWISFLRDGQIHTGERFNKSLDAGGMKPTQDQSIIVGLEQFHSPEYFDVHQCVREASHVLQFLHFTFLCKFTPLTFVDIALYSNIKGVASGQDDFTWILGASLLDWKNAIIDCCNPERSFHTRFFMNCMLVMFQCNGYSQVFEAYSKITLQDKTFTLLPKGLS